MTWGLLISQYALDVAKQTIFRNNFTEGQVLLNRARDGWRNFVHALYDANTDVPLPPLHMVTRITIDVEPGRDFPAFVFEVIGLTMPIVPVAEEQVDGDQGSETSDNQ